MGFIEDIVSKGYGGYRGWEATAAEADYKATGGSDKWDPGSSSQYASQNGQTSAPSGDFASLVGQAQALYKPITTSLEASIPEIKSAVASKTEILNKQYTDLIASIKGAGTTATNRQTVVTAGELGKRGIDPTSTLYGQELTNVLNPLTKEYAGLESTAATNQQAGQLDLATLETEQLRNVSNTIDQLTNSANEGAINTALQLYQQAQAASQNAATLKESQRQADIANALKQKIYETIQLPQSQMDIANIQSTIKNRGSTNSGGYQSYYDEDGGSDWEVVA